MCQALVDTGSVVSLVKKDFVERLGLRYGHMRALPQLTGITHTVLPVLGSVYLNVQVGTRVVTHLFAAVPDNYLDTDLLLGADILKTAPMTWDDSRKVIEWNGFTYPVRMLRARPSKKRVRHIRVDQPSNSSIAQLRLTTKIVIPQYTAGVYSVHIDEPPGTIIEFSTQNDKCQTSAPLCLEVTGTKTVFLPFVNNTKLSVTIKVGTLIGSYQELNPRDIEEPISMCRKTKIQNGLLPESVELNHDHEHTRESKIKKLISQQDWSHLTADQQKQLGRMLCENHSVFIREKNEMGKFHDVQAHINVTDPNPVRSPTYRYPEKAKEIISSMLEEMEQKGIIEPSTAAWLSPIVLVNKPDASKRMCLDYRKVNSHLEVDIHPLPRLEEMVETAAGNRYYATLDMKDACYQIELDEASRDLTTFSDGVALYRFKRLPFGLSCSPAVFSRIMSNMLAPLTKLGWVKNYLDDVVVWAPSFSCLLKRINQLFKHFVSKGVKLNISKCHFAQEEVKFLGHIISQEGCKPCPDNISAINEMKSPTSVKEVRRFLGMCGFYRKHIKDYTKIAIPLTNLLRYSELFLWTADCQSSFDQLKHTLTTAPVLVKAQMTKPFELHTNASLDNVGAVLMQRHEGLLKPVGYFSKKLKPVEQRYSTTDHEALAIILACRRFHHFLWGVPFTIHTDHQPLVSVFKRKTKSPRMNRWVIEMQDYRFKVEYRPGKNNEVADQLSRPVRPIVHQSRDNYLGFTQDEFKSK